MRFALLLGACSLLVCCLLSAGSLQADEAARPLDFGRDVRPILSDRCFTCHGPDAAARATEMRLDSEAAIRADLGGYAAIVPGKPDESELWKRIASTDPDEVMPPAEHGKPLTDNEKARLRQWIEAGAPWSQHWSFVAPQRPPLPTVNDTAWPRTGIDHFILAKLEAAGLRPSPEANKETLLRRVTLDLTGLPPTMAESDAFLADQSPEAYERVVDRLLASPRYGERMVLPWLDAARYADSNGYQTDGTRAMWPWRDWVIRALNANMPFDQFTLEQVAGDMLPEPTTDQKIASGFNRNHMLNGEGGRIAEESRVEYVVDRVDTTSTVWLGLTMGCCRCHDHKYDPLSQREFYQFYAYFNNLPESGGVDRRNSTAAPTLELPTPEQTAKIGELNTKIADLETQLRTRNEQLPGELAAWEQSVVREGLPPEITAVLAIEAAARSPEQAEQLADHHATQDPKRKELEEQINAVRQELTGVQNSVLITMVMEERPDRRETFILKRGVYDQYGDKVDPALPTTLPPLPEGAPNNRLGVAQWLVHPSNPLTARVAVNRAWTLFFGQGLVKTGEDFGAQGELPSHPELLDWLAVEFREGWNVKALHKLIVMSAAYRQSSQVTPEVLEVDPENRLLTRGPRNRLDSFALRDQALFVSGLLVEREGGPPVKPYQPEGIWEDFSFGQIRYEQDHGESLYRRSLYTFWRRSVGPTTMFDTSARQVCTVRLPKTNTPLHALVLMNDVAYVEAARVFAARLLREGGPTPAERLETGFRMVTGRRPTSDERSILVSGFERVLAHYQADREAAAKLLTAGEFPRDEQFDVAEHAAYAAVCNLLLNLDEAITKE